MAQLWCQSLVLLQASALHKPAGLHEAKSPLHGPRMTLIKLDAVAAGERHVMSAVDEMQAAQQQSILQTCM